MKNKNETAKTNLRIVVENGTFYLYDKLSSGNCVCYGYFPTMEEAEKRLEECLKIERGAEKSAA